MTATITDLDLSLRYGILLGSQVFLFLWTYYTVAPATPGRARVFRVLPLLPVFLLLYVLFDIDRTEEYFSAIYCYMNFVWLTQFKVWALCLNRGQLVKSYDSGSSIAFALCLLSGVTIAFDEKQILNEKGQAYRDAKFEVIRFTQLGRLQEAGSILLRIVAKVGLLFLMEKGYFTFVESGHPFMRDFCLGWFLYGSTSLVQDLTSLLILGTLNLKTAPSFYSPWLSQSMQEFWSRRYNVSFALTLRDLIYDPIAEGRWVHGSSYFQKVSAPPLRRVVGNLVTFIISGAIHGALVFYGYSLGSFPKFFALFFVACAFVIIGESIVKGVVKQAGLQQQVTQQIPSWIYSAYFLGMIFTLNHLFVWRDVAPLGYDKEFVEGMMMPLKIF